MTVEQYRAVDADHYSRLKLALQSAAHYHNPPKVEEDGNPALMKGSMLHAYVLEGREIDFVVKPKFNPKSNDESDVFHWNKKWCRQWTAEQTLPILNEDDIADQLGMRDALKKHPIVQEIFESCPERERPVFATYNGLPLKALLDGAGYDNSGNRIIFDLKSTVDASPEGFARAVSRQKYTLQLALYSAVLSLAEEREQRPSWLWIAVENKAPYNVAIYTPTPQHYDLGEQQLNYCTSLVKKCRETGEWPGYFSGIQEVPWRKFDEFRQPIEEPTQDPTP